MARWSNGVIPVQTPTTVQVQSMYGACEKIASDFGCGCGFPKVFWFWTF